MAQVINIAACFDKFADTYSPKIVGELNGQNVMVVRCEGDRVPWHTHDDEDELFWVVEGVLEIHLRDEVLELKPGEFYIVSRGVEHRVIPKGHVKLILFEPAGIAHTGSVRAEITKDRFEHLA